MIERPIAWPLVALFVGLALTSCLLALQAIVTFPTALLAGITGTLLLFPPKGGLVSRHYVTLAALGLLCALATFLWQRTQASTHEECCNAPSPAVGS